jgi:hypothetical protein
MPVVNFAKKSNSIEGAGLQRCRTFWNCLSVFLLSWLQFIETLLITCPVFSQFERCKLGCLIFVVKVKTDVRWQWMKYSIDMFAKWESKKFTVGDREVHKKWKRFCFDILGDLMLQNSWNGSDNGSLSTNKACLIYSWTFAFLFKASASIWKSFSCLTILELINGMFANLWLIQSAYALLQVLTLLFILFLQELRFHWIWN